MRPVQAQAQAQTGRALRAFGLERAARRIKSIIVWLLLGVGTLCSLHDGCVQSFNFLLF